MSLEIINEPIPLKTDAAGIVRVGGTRVPLDSVIFAFNQGATAEEIVQQYPSLDLADVYAVVSYYLRHRDEVDVYLCQRQKQTEEIRRQNEARFPMNDIRERLLARRAK